MTSRSGKHTTPRHFVTSEHWPALNEAANGLGFTSGAAMVRQLIHETVTDATKAARTCKRIAQAIRKE